MSEKQPIAQKYPESAKDKYLYIVGFYALAALSFFMAYRYRDEDPAAAIAMLCIGSGTLVLAVAYTIARVKINKIPDIIIWYEDGLICFYNGFKCKPSEIYKIKTGYNAALILYTQQGKHICRRVRNLRLVVNTVNALRYGKLYTETDLRVLMHRRETEKFQF